jgi:hypothetical protein
MVGERVGYAGFANEEMKIGTSYIFLASVNVVHSAPPALVLISAFVAFIGWCMFVTAT